jgi:hypothetical protein
MLKAKAEAWKTGPNGADICETPGGKVVRHVGPGAPVSTVGETLDGKHRLAHVGAAEIGPMGALAYIARGDLVPNVPGGDPDFDKKVWIAVESRSGADATDAAVKAAVTPLYSRIDGMKAKAAAFAKDIADD